MVNIILLIVLLNNRLSNNLLSWNWNLFYSGNVLSLYWFHYRFKCDLFIISSVYIDFNSFPLDDRLVNSLVIDFFSRFSNDFFPLILSNNWFFGKRLKIQQLIFLWHELNIFFIVNDLFFINWLKVDCLIRLLVFSVYYFLSVLNRLGNIR